MDSIFSYRWPIQIVALFVFAWAFVLSLRVYHWRPELRSHIIYSVIWLGFCVLFFGWMVGRVIVYHGEPPVFQFGAWWVNTVFLIGGIGFLLTYAQCRR